MIPASRWSSDRACVFLNVRHVHAGGHGCAGRRLKATPPVIARAAVRRRSGSESRACRIQTQSAGEPRAGRRLHLIDVNSLAKPSSHVLLPFFASFNTPARRPRNRTERKAHPISSTYQSFCLATEAEHVNSFCTDIPQGSVSTRWALAHDLHFFRAASEGLPSTGSKRLTEFRPHEPATTPKNEFRKEITGTKLPGEEPWNCRVQWSHWERWYP
jgi:hypothetical protein